MVRRARATALLSIEEWGVGGWGGLANREPRTYVCTYMSTCLYVYIYICIHISIEKERESYNICIYAYNHDCICMYYVCVCLSLSLCGCACMSAGLRAWLMAGQLEVAGPRNRNASIQGGPNEGPPSCGRLSLGRP